MTKGVEGRSDQPVRAPEARRGRARGQDTNEANFELALAAPWTNLGATATLMPVCRDEGVSAFAQDANASGRTTPATRGDRASDAPQANAQAGDARKAAHAPEATFAGTALDPTRLSERELAGQAPSRKELQRTREERADGDARPADRPQEGRLRDGRAISSRDSQTAGQERPLPSLPASGPHTRPILAPPASLAVPSAPRSQMPSNEGTKSVNSGAGAGRSVRGTNAVPIGGARTNLASLGSERSATAPNRDATAATGVTTRSDRVASRTPSVSSKPTPGTPRAAPPELESPVAAQALRGLAAALRQGEGAVTIRLSPENLGDLRIALAVRESKVVARVEASSEEAARLLREHAPALREALEGQGYAITRIDVEQVSPALMQLRSLGAAWSMPVEVPRSGDRATDSVPPRRKGEPEARFDSRAARSTPSSSGTPIATD